MLTGVRTIEILDVPNEPGLGENDILVSTHYSGISRGTDLTFYRGLNPFFRKRFDREYRLFFDDEEAEDCFPRNLGYENVGQVVQTGAAVEAFKEGDIVFSTYSHVTQFVSKPGMSFPLPKGLPPKHGIFYALLLVAYNAILDAQIVPGETVVVFGMGVIGNLTVQLAKLAGADRVIAVDLACSRLKKAKESGADELINPKDTPDVAKQVRDLTDLRGPDVVIEASGSTVALNEAIRTACFQGRVVVVSFLVGEARGLYLGEEFHHNRIRPISSQACDVNPGLHPRWNHQRKLDAGLKVMPKLKLDHLITHELAFEDAAQAFALLDTSPEDVLQVILTY